MIEEEPWTPELGQWVRVRISPECSFHDDHQTTSNGLVGCVEEDVRDSECGVQEEYPGALQNVISAGHWWFVVFDAPIGRSDTGEPYYADTCTAIELEPLPALPAAAPSGEGGAS